LSRCNIEREKLRLLDHLVGAGEQHCRHVEGESRCSVEVNHELKLAWLDDWQVGWPFALRMRPAPSRCPPAGSGPLLLGASYDNPLREELARLADNQRLNRWHAADFAVRKSIDLVAHRLML